VISNLYRIAPCPGLHRGHLRFALRWLRDGAVARGYGRYADGYARQEFGVPPPPSPAASTTISIRSGWRSAAR
jgi:hypothetical protein